MMPELRIGFMPAPKSFSSVLKSIEEFAAPPSSLSALQHSMVNLIRSQLAGYDWVGFYMIDPNDTSTLVLGPFAGEPTQHVRIPVTRGICGAAVADGQTIVIEDVASDLRYLSCSIQTKSEIVVPIRANGQIVGEIDVDGHELAAFGAEDKAFLEACAKIAGAVFEQERRS
jgi:GAF domain-containing protein